MKKLIFSLFVSVLFFSCTKKNTKQIDVSNIEVAFDIDRFDQKFYTADSTDLPTLKNEYPYLFPPQNLDTVWYSKMNPEGEEHALFEETQELFAENDKIRSDLSYVFKHVKHYFPKFSTPKVITVISNVDFMTKVIYADSLLFVSLDMYLGQDHAVYHDFPKYMSTNFTESQLTVDVAKEIAFEAVPYVKNRTFIDRIIQEGKTLYLTSLFVPNKTETQVMEYEPEKMKWAQEHEAFIWQYMIQKKLIYSVDSDLIKRFISEAPFSKFFLESDRESPGRIGAWLGLRIVESYMNRTGKTLQEMLLLDNTELFKESKYKPNKK